MAEPAGSGSRLMVDGVILFDIELDKNGETGMMKMSAKTIMAMAMVIGEFPPLPPAWIWICGDPYPPRCT